MDGYDAMRYKAKRPPRNPRPSPEALRGAVQTESGDTAPLLYLEQLPNLTNGLTPGKLRRILADAEQGNIVEHRSATVWSATKVVLYCRKSKCFPLYLCIYRTFANFAPMQYGDSTLAP